MNIKINEKSSSTISFKNDTKELSITIFCTDYSDCIDKIIIFWNMLTVVQK